jgi:hypothetical protein
VNPYLPSIGFGVAVDGLYGMKAVADAKAQKVFKCIFMLAPPASLYGDPPLTDDCGFTQECDMASGMTAPRFIDGYHKFKDAMYTDAMEVLVDIRAIGKDKKPAKNRDEDGSSISGAAQQQLEELLAYPVKHESVGWAVLPVFTDPSTVGAGGAAYVNSGMYHLPIVSGAFPPELLERDETLSQLVQQAVMDTTNNNKKSKSKAALKLIPGASAFVRLLDSQQDGSCSRSYYELMVASQVEADPLAMKLPYTTLDATQLPEGKDGGVDKKFALPGKSEV